MGWALTGNRRRLLRVLIPLIMLALGVITVWRGGWRGLLALVPILIIHVIVAAVVVPLWLRYRRRSRSASVYEGG